MIFWHKHGMKEIDFIIRGVTKIHLLTCIIKI